MTGRWNTPKLGPRRLLGKPCKERCDSPAIHLLVSKGYWVDEWVHGRQSELSSPAPASRTSKIGLGVHQHWCGFTSNYDPCQVDQEKCEFFIGGITAQGSRSCQERLSGCSQRSQNSVKMDTYSTTKILDIWPVKLGT